MYVRGQIISQHLSEPRQFFMYSISVFHERKICSPNCKDQRPNSIFDCPGCGAIVKGNEDSDIFKIIAQARYLTCNYFSLLKNA